MYTMIIQTQNIRSQNAFFYQVNLILEIVPSKTIYVFCVWISCNIFRVFQLYHSGQFPNLDPIPGQLNQYLAMFCT